MKKFLYIILPIGFLASFAATAIAADKDYYVYAEQGAGGDSMSANNDFNGFYLKFASGVTNPSILYNNVGVAAPMQIPVVGEIGVSHTWDQFYLGGEAQFGYNFSVNKSAYAAADGKNVNYQLKWQTMATMQIGGLISDTNVIYADAGYAFGDFNYSYGSSRKTAYINGPAVGAGVSLQLTDHLNFDANYHFVYYLNKSVENTVSVKARQNIITAGLSVHF